jgi:hypothetical protein
LAYILEPEVSGQLGEKTVIDTSVHPPIVTHLHFVFYGWLGDDLIECFPVFLITERLKLKLVEANLTGYQVKDCEVEVSDEFILLQPDVTLPGFYWFVVNGKDHDDFTISKNKLRISDQAYSILNQFNLTNAIVAKSDG